MRNKSIPEIMKNSIKTVTLGLMIGLMACESDQTNPRVVIQNPEVPVAQETVVTKRSKKIKLALLLDTSSSMSGLIDQAKNQLWKIVNQLALAKDADGEDPEIEIALYQYGNDGLSAMDGYVQQISGFTSELDEISEQLFALSTDGGSEYCGTVIEDAIQNLEWSDHEGDLQIIFIAGNESFGQGPKAYAEACRLAVNKNVIVNTIFCGDFHEGVRISWNDGALHGQGKYMNIDHDAQIVHIKSPYDEKIIACNTKLNDTYIPYGNRGRIKKEKQITQDENAMELSSANAAKRYMSKGSKAYKNKSWDLVDAAEQESFDIEEVDKLPENMRSMNKDQKLAYIDKLKVERETIKREIAALSKQRRLYVENEKAKSAQGDAQLDDVIVLAIKEQANQKSYHFE